MKNIYPFSEWLRDALENAHMTQMELALRLGSSQGQISRYVQGHEVPKLARIVEILAVFGKKLEVVEQK